MLGALFRNKVKEDAAILDEHKDMVVSKYMSLNYEQIIKAISNDFDSRNYEAVAQRFPSGDTKEEVVFWYDDLKDLSFSVKKDDCSLCIYGINQYTGLYLFYNPDSGWSSYLGTGKVTKQSNQLAAMLSKNHNIMNLRG